MEGTKKALYLHFRIEEGRPGFENEHIPWAATFGPWGTIH